MNTRIFPVIVNTSKLENRNLIVHYPQICNLPNSRIQDYINRTILNNVYSLIKEQGYYDNSNVSITGTYELKNNDKGILSLTLINYAFSGGAHGITIVKGLSFDIITGYQYNLSDLFKQGSDYVDKISDIIRKQIKERDFPTLDKFKKIKPNQDFYIADKCLVIFFQLYEIAPYAAGIPYFPISIYDLQDIISAKGPLDRMF